MGTDSRTLCPIPDLAIVAETIRLAEAAEAERYEQRPVDDLSYPGDEIDPLLRPAPAQRELLTYLRRLQEQDDGETVARLYGLYRAGNLACTTREEAIERYRSSSELALQPIHRPYGAADLAGKAPLADGLRRGLALLGLAIAPAPTCPAG